MKALLFSGLLALCSFGCVFQELDETIMKVEQRMVENEDLFASAANKFADSFESLANKKHEFQQYEVDVENDKWLDDHTENGIVQASPEDFEAMLEKRDSRLSALRESKKSTRLEVDNFRTMVTKKVEVVKAIYEKKVEAQAAKKSAAAAIDSALKAIAGFAASAATFIPLGL